MDLLLERGQKVASGRVPTVLGKPRLLKSLLGEIPSLAGEVIKGQNLEIGYFEQETKPTDNTCLQEVWNAFPHFNQQEVRAALARCGLTTKHIESKIQVLSGGEKAKVRSMQADESGNQRTGAGRTDQPLWMWTPRTS